MKCLPLSLWPTQIGKLPCVIKSGLVLAQMNAESERSLSINARVVTKERCVLGDTTICGLRAVKDAVRFYDPEGKPEKIPVTREMKAFMFDLHMRNIKQN